MPQKSREAAYRKFTVCSETNGAILLATDVAARGLDFSDVSWIIQYDAPVDPSMFVHRIGRTARAGRDGKSLLLLCPAEDACLPFFSNRNVPLRNLLDDPGAWRTLYLGPSLIEGVNVWAHEHPQLLTQEFPHSATFEGDRQGKVLSSQDVEDAVKLPASDLQWSWAFCRTALLSDRDVLLKAAAAFVSFLRAYKEHQLQYIFPFSDLEIGALATSMALLRLPRVKEILGKKIEGFQQSSVHPKTVTFKDLNRQAEWEATKKGDTAKLEKEKKEACAARDKCATRFVNGPKPRTQMNVKRTGTTQRRAKKQRVLDEWENLQLEERLAKKLRTGKLSVQEYERLLRGQDGTLDDRSTEIFESGTDTGENGVADANLHGSALQATKPPRWVKRGKRGGKKK